MFKWLNELTFAWNELKRRFKKSQRKWVYIYLLIKTPCQKWYKTDWLSEKKSWEERKACREKFKVETKRENILKELISLHLRLQIYNLCLQTKMWWDIIVWNLNKNIGLILRLFDSFASTRIAFICWYWYSQNILNLTQLQRNLFLYIYISGIILRLTKSDCVFHLPGLVFDFDWLLSDTKSSLVWCNNLP